ncbi:hypothetical protein D3C81_940740 [compost metagenome]
MGLEAICSSIDPSGSKFYGHGNPGRTDRDGGLPTVADQSDTASDYHAAFGNHTRRPGDPDFR